MIIWIKRPNQAGGASPLFPLDGDIHLRVYLAVALLLWSLSRATKPKVPNTRPSFGRATPGRFSSLSRRTLGRTWDFSSASCSKARDQVITDHCLRLARPLCNFGFKTREPGIALFSYRG